MKYLINNDHSEPMKITIEPWAEEISISAGSSLLLTILSDREGLLETAIGPNTFTVWLWGGCRVKLAVNGEDQAVPSLLIPAP